MITLVLCAACGSSATATPDATPDAPGLPPGVTAVALDGCGPFFAGTFQIGGAPFRLIVDTGSSTLGVAGASCTTCSDAGVSPLYTPGPTAIDRQKTATAVYGDGQGWSGEIYQDAVQAGPAVTANVDLVAMTSQHGFFAPGECGMPQGILGMGPKVMLLAGTTGYMDALVATGVADQFAMHFCGTTGTLWLGGFDPAATTAAPAFVPMQSYRGYTVELADAMVDGTSAAQPGAGGWTALVDSGGPNILLPVAAQAPLVAKIAANATFQAQFGDASFFATSNANQCKPSTMSPAQIDAALPPLVLKLGSGAASTSLELPATGSYLQVYSEAGTTYYCPALFGLNTIGIVDLGNSVIRSSVTIFDRAHMQMGFAPTGC